MKPSSDTRFHLETRNLNLYLTPNKKNPHFLSHRSGTRGGSAQQRRWAEREEEEEEGEEREEAAVVEIVNNFSSTVTQADSPLKKMGWKELAMPLCGARFLSTKAVHVEASLRRQRGEEGAEAPLHIYIIITTRIRNYSYVASEETLPNLVGKAT